MLRSPRSYLSASDVHRMQFLWRFLFSCAPFVKVVSWDDRRGIDRQPRLVLSFSGIVYNCCMLSYATVKDRPREFLAATGLTHTEFARLLPALATAYAVRYPPDKTLDGKVRQRQVGGGANGALPQREDKRLFLLV